MSTLMSAASDAPRAYSAYTPARLTSTPPAFADDRERYVWIVAEYRRRSKLPGVNNGQLARDLAAVAFGITIADLCGPSKKAKFYIPRQKIACVIRALSRITIAKVGQLICRNHVTVLDALTKFEDEVSAGLKGDK